MRRLTIGAALIASVLLAAACGTVTTPAKASGARGVVTISNETGGPWTCSFNPFTTATNYLSVGPVYEPLAFVNTLRNGKATPWLATAWRWAAGNRSITFTIRKDVRFTDGTPMTAADVVFTFDLLRKFPALDHNGVWSVLSSVTRAGPGQVLMNFKDAAVPYFYYFADQIPIVPEHIWSKIKNPAAYPNTHPVGTGAFEMQSCTRQNITYTADPRYWMPGEPHIAKVEYPAFESNDPANTFLATGLAQWGSQFIPSIKAFYLAQNPAYHYWFPPTVDVALLINLTDPLLSDVRVRQAMAYAIDRPRVSAIGEYGYEPPANQADIVTPTFSGWLDKPLLAKYGYTYNPAKARRLLAAAGFRRGPGGILTDPAGHKLAFSVLNVRGYSDWENSVQLIRQELRAVGIELTPDNEPPATYYTRLYDGRFQLAYDSQAGGPTPYYELAQWLSSGNSAPVGRPAASNYERYRNRATDRLIISYAMTSSTAVQHRIVAKLEQAVLADVPFIPVTESVDWFEYDTAAFSGWPTPASPYAQPSAYVAPDWGQVLLHLTPK
jgi:peptide/nickel transport system substrate-binding protein